MLADDPSVEVLGCVGDAITATEIVRAEGVDVLVADEDLPGEDGAPAIRSLLEADPSVRVILLTGAATSGAVVEQLELGIRGLLLRGCAPDLLRVAVRAVTADGGVVVDPQLTPLLIERATGCCVGAGGPLTLSKRQADVFALLPEGLTNKQIAERLGVGEETVKTHLKHAMRKLHLSSRGEAATLAQREGLTSSDQT